METVPTTGTIVSSSDYRGDHRIIQEDTTVNHTLGREEMDDGGDRKCEAYCDTCEGMEVGLRMLLQPFLGMQMYKMWQPTKRSSMPSGSY